MLRKIKHVIGKHTWQHYSILGGPMERVCIECGREEEWEDGVWKEKKK